MSYNCINNSLPLGLHYHHLHGIALAVSHDRCLANILFSSSLSFGPLWWFVLLHGPLALILPGPSWLLLGPPPWPFMAPPWPSSLALLHDPPPWFFMPPPWSWSSSSLVLVLLLGPGPPPAGHSLPSLSPRSFSSPLRQVTVMFLSIF
ncbi:hypothetical protein BDR05DRAFT_1055647 [Suillus weaverae]|nr:hypothetical protein BDR05DRAFT_1055647 [Suillus weaverae]